MSIFRRDSPPEPNPPQPAQAPRKPAPNPKRERASGHSPSPGPGTHVARGSKVIGEISGTAELVIDGQVDGEIELENRLVVGPEGRVDGKIVARAVQVGGKVHGNVRGLERVEVLASGSLEGDVVSPRVVIAEGAFFKGKVEMVDGSKAAASARPAPSPSAPPASKGAPPKPESGVKSSAPRDLASPGASQPGASQPGAPQPAKHSPNEDRSRPHEDPSRSQKGMPGKPMTATPGGARKGSS